MLEYEADWYGRELIKVNPKNTSRSCYSYGHVAKEIRKTQSQFACGKCGYTANADVNAAQNILGLIGLVLANVEGLVPVRHHSYVGEEFHLLLPASRQVSSGSVKRSSGCPFITSNSHFVHNKCCFCPESPILLAGL